MLASNSPGNRPDSTSGSPRFATLLLTAVLAISGCGQADPSKTSPDSMATLKPQMLVSRGQLQFVSDFEAGCRLAAEKGLPCLLFFTADWCTYCHQMEETAFTDPTVTNLAGQFVCVIVDADLEKEVCEQFSISGYPTVQFLSSRGRVLNRLVGRQSAPQLLAGMQAALKRFAWLNDSDTKLR